ncbi:MAG: AAA family ATPase [Pirellulaceae bacterium]
MIRTISIRGFRSINSVQVELEPVTVLVGRSGSGKSNFVRAIRFLRDYLITGDRDSSAGGSFQKLAPANQGEPQLTYKVAFDIEGLEGTFQYSLCLPYQAGKVEESLKLGEKVLFSHVAGKWVTEPNVQSPPPPTCPMLGKIPAISETVIAFSALTNGVGCYEFPFGVLGQSATSKGDGLADDARNYLFVMKGITSNIRNLKLRKSINGSLMALNPTVSAVELNSIQSPTSILVTHQFNGSRLSLSLSEESEGFRRFFAHLLAIYQDSSKQLLVFEEPENGIYPGALQLLADELKAAPYANRGQVLLTTHSPGLLNHFDIESLRVVTLKNGGTQIGKVASEQVQAVKDDLMRTGELLTVDEARIADEEVVAP